MDHFIAIVLSHTPRWVWLLLTVLMVLGLRQRRDRVLSRPRVWSMPAVLVGWAWISTGLAFGWRPATLLAFVAAAGLGLMLGRLWALIWPAKRPVQALGHGRYAVPGSWAPLALILTVFTVRYGVSAAMAMVPELASVPVFAILVSALYGLPAGLLVARALAIEQSGKPVGHNGRGLLPA